MKPEGSAVWQGGIKDGKGATSTRSGALDAYPHGFASGFEGKAGCTVSKLLNAKGDGSWSM